MLKAIKLKYYYADELKNYGFTLNDENGLYEYKSGNKILISIKSWNFCFNFNEVLGNEIYEVIDVILKLEDKLEFEYEYDK